MRIAILLMLVCCSANATMYSCVDKNGTKVLKNYPCEQNEKQQVIKTEQATESYYIINSTGEKQRVDSFQPAQSEPKQITMQDLQNKLLTDIAAGKDTQRLRIEIQGLARAQDAMGARDISTDSADDVRKTSDFNSPASHHFNSEPDFLIPAPPPIEPDFKQSPSRITNCDLAGCRDELGNRHNYLGGICFPTQKEMETAG